MASIAEFTIPADDFPLGRIFDDLPDATVELERVVPTDTDILPYFWVTMVTSLTSKQRLRMSTHSIR